MSLLNNRRIVVPERMDAPNIDPASHRAALAGLARINRFSKTAGQILPHILDFKLPRLSMLDIACGSGDVPIAVADAAAKQGVQIDLTLLDRSSTALNEARSAAITAGIQCTYVQGDALAELPPGQFDVVTSSLFLHHLPGPDQVIDLLRRVREVARKKVIISDLRRSRLAYAGTWIACRLLTSSPVVHFDGPVSVRAAWTVGELTSMADRAGMTQSRIIRCFPWRMLLTWQRP